MRKMIGADCGNDALKITVANKEEIKKVEVMNVISPGYVRRTISGGKLQLVNLLDVNVLEGNKDLGRYFVGGLAYKAARGDLMERTREDKKSKSLETLIVLVTGVAFSLYDPISPKNKYQVDLGTVLPIEEYFKDELKDEFYAKLYGKTFTVKFNDEAFKGAEITITFTNVVVAAENVAATVYYAYDDDGEYKKDYANLTEEIHLGIDIGSITTDVAIIDGGEFISLFGIPMGTSEPLDKIIQDLKDQYDLEISRHQLDYIIRKEKPLKININGEVKDLTDALNIIKENRYRNFVSLLVNKIHKELSVNGINTKLINRVNMIGGGALTCYNLFSEAFSLSNVNLVEDPRFANSKGVLKLIMSQVESEEIAQDEVLNS